MVESGERLVGPGRAPLGAAGPFLGEEDVRGIVAEALNRLSLQGKRVLVLVPDSTRTAPISLLFRLLHEQLGGQVAALDYLVALGTHQPMGEDALNRLVGISAEERRTTYAGVNIYNHRWDLADALVTVGEIPAAEIGRISNGLLVQDLPVRLNRLVF